MNDLGWDAFELELGWMIHGVKLLQVEMGFGA